MAALDLAVVPSARAQEHDLAHAQVRQAPRMERRILVLRADDSARSAAEMRVDRVLGQALAEMGFIVNVSPTPFRDAQLAMGCSRSVRSCGARVAVALESEQLAVVSLRERTGEGSGRLELSLFAPGRERSGEVELSVDSALELEREVRELARRVYGDVAPESRILTDKQQEAAERTSSATLATRTLVASPAPLTQQPAPASGPPAAPKRNPPLRAVGWSAITVGGALVVGGLATSLAADHSSDAYAQRTIRDQDDADDALASYTRAEHQADVARILFGTGGAVLMTGAAMLLWERFVPSRRDRTLHLSATPAGRGALLFLSGAPQGGRP